MTWRSQLARVRDDFKDKVAPSHSRQVARKLMRDIARMEASKAKREGRKPRRNNQIAIYRGLVQR